MRKLIANVSILYLAKLYHPGDELPTNNPDMMNDWIKCGSAKWQADEEEVALPDDKEEKDAKEPAKKAPAKKKGK